MQYKSKSKKVARYARRQVVGRFKKRYIRNNGNFKVNKLVSDVMYLKNSLNTERKNYDIDLSTSLGVNAVQNGVNADPVKYGPVAPDRQTPKVLPLALPYRGVEYNQRVGNQLKITNISIRLQIERQNRLNNYASVAYRVFLMFKKSGDDSPVSPADLYEQDANGNYTPMCYRNPQEFKTFYSPKLLACRGLIRDNLAGNSSTQKELFYKNMQQKLNVTVKFQNGVDAVCTAMRPYLVILTDDQSNSDNEKTHFTGKVRISYVDN